MYYIARQHGSDQEARGRIRVLLRAFEVKDPNVEICSIDIGSDESDYEDGHIRAIAGYAGRLHHYPG